MLVDTVKELKARKAAIRAQIVKLNAEDRGIDRAIKAITALGATASAPVAKATPTKKKRKMSAAGRKAIAAAAKARWAKINAKKTPVAPKPAKKRKMSAAGRAALIAAVKARWAKVKAEKAKAAKK